MSQQPDSSTPDQESPDRESPDRRTPEQQRDSRTGQSAAARIANQASWVDQQIRVAMEKGEFDDLPGAGKPIKDLGAAHDPDWWLKGLIEREQIALLPMSLQLRREDAGLDEELDKVAVESEVRRVLDDFNQRVIAARYRAPEGPPLITMPRDVDATVEAWRERRTARLAASKAALAAEQAAAPPRKWWRRR